MLEAVRKVLPKTKYQRCTVHFYRNVFSATRRAKGEAGSKDAQSDSRQGSRKATREKAEAVKGGKEMDTASKMKQRREDGVCAHALGRACFDQGREKRYGISHNQALTWGRWYLEEGEEALGPRNGNPYAALHTSKSLSEVERLRLIIAKQEVEIARLKKGYWVEGAGADREYVTGSGKTTKSSKR